MIRLCALAVAAVLFVAPAAAQQWVDPERHFVLNHGPAWRPVTPQTVNPEVLAAFESTEPGASRLCNVRRQRFPAPTQMDQPAVNRWMQVFTAGPPGVASDSSIDEVEGVAFINYAVAGGPFAGRYRAFGLPAGAGIVRTEILCAAHSPLSALDDAALDSFFSSLQLTPEH